MRARIVDALISDQHAKLVLGSQSVEENSSPLDKMVLDMFDPWLY